LEFQKYLKKEHKMINWLKKLLKPKEKIKEEEDEFTYFKPEEIEYTINSELLINDVEYINKLGDKYPTILLMDDFKAMITLLSNELKRIESIDVFKEFNIISATGEFAAFSVDKFIKDGGCVEIAFLDITLGGVINNIELDGIDISIKIKECNPDSNIKFITGHTLNRRNPEIFKFAQKFENFFNKEMDEKKEVKLNGEKINIYEHVIGKNDSRLILMEQAIKEYLGRQ